MLRRLPLRPIVLIDDDQDEIFITSWRLKKAGIDNPRLVFTKPEEVALFFEQAAHCDEELPLLVLCDVKLPGIRGYELVAAAKHHKCLRAVPIWMLSNSSFPADIAQAEAAGADGYLVKPLSLTALRTILEGGLPAQDADCHAFTRKAPPLVQSIQGGMEVAVSDVPALRRMMINRGVVVAEVDRNLRYLWVDNPHPDFDPALVVGKRDDELIAADDAAELMSLKRGVLERGKHASRALRFRRSDGWHCYAVSAYPIRSTEGDIQGVITLGVDSTYCELPAGATA